MTEIIIAVITGGMSLLGVIFTNNRSNAKVQAKIETAQAVTDYKIEELTREVRLHNNFAQRVPIIEKDIKHIYHEIEEIKHR